MDGEKPKIIDGPKQRLLVDASSSEQTPVQQVIFQELISQGRFQLFTVDTQSETDSASVKSQEIQ